MVLINIDRLSDSELKYIAEQENLEDFASLTREEIIEALEEIYEDDGTSASAKAENAKFIKTLTDTESDVTELPGVTPLTKNYNVTEIHCIIRDNNWAYAFWSLSEHDRNKLAEAGSFSLIVRVGLVDKPEKTFDINVTFEDSSWSIELPWPGKQYYLSLMAKYDDSEVRIAKSEIITSPKSYFSDHTDELADSDNYDFYVTPLVSNGGESVSNLAYDIIKSVRKADK